MSTGEPILRADALSLSVDGADLLSDISLTIPQAARVLIRGESGAGKTTLFNVLGLLEPPTDGSLYVNGTDTATLSEQQRAQVRRDTVGIVFQDFKLIDDLTARENAALPQEHVGERDEVWLDELFERLDISTLADNYPRELSGGEKQRVAIARALANRPDVVLADEPTGQLDPATEARVLDLLFELHESTDVALVVISHDPRLADRFDRVIRLEDGRISEKSDDTAEVTRNVD
jgi:ABC-type lipoprotein export system ATPase subunit